MQEIGKIDIEKYQGVVSENIITDDVVLTNNRMEHIIERRGRDFYDEYRPLFGDIVSDPDYIFKDTRENTALVCKCFFLNIIMTIIYIINHTIIRSNFC